MDQGDYVSLRAQLSGLFESLISNDRKTALLAAWEFTEYNCGLESLQARRVDYTLIRVLDATKNYLENEGDTASCQTSMDDISLLAEAKYDVEEHRRKLCQAAGLLAHAVITSDPPDLLLSELMGISDCLCQAAGLLEVRLTTGVSSSAQIVECRRQIEHLEEISLATLGEEHFDIKNINPRRRLSPLAQPTVETEINID